MGQCDSVDGKQIPASGSEQCWKAGGVKWTQWMQSPISNPNLPTAVATIVPKTQIGIKAVSDAKDAQATAVAATAAADKAATTAAVATQNADSAKSTQVVAVAAAVDAKTVRDKCIAAANDAHKKAMDACGPELGAKKEGFGEMDANACGMWLMFVLIMLVFIAICLQGDEKSAAERNEKPFSINAALV